jgi:hypothetical protein
LSTATGIFSSDILVKVALVEIPVAVDKVTEVSLVK